MAKKRHQHFIPQTYLRPFAHTQINDKFLVNAFDKVQNRIIHDISVKDICVESDLYTMTHLNHENKYLLEDYFSDQIETNYPKVYKLLVLDKKEFISPEERQLILLTTLSMYFRTPKFLNQFAKFTTSLLEKASLNINEIEFLGINFNFDDKSFAEIQKEIKEKKRIDYLKTQMLLMNEFLKFKAFDGITVIELIGEQEFITSDNPVEIRNSKALRFELFDQNNSIYVPLNPKFALFIAPRSLENPINLIYYQRDNFMQDMVLNSCVFRNAERWIMGSKTGITNFLANNLDSKPADENHPIIIKSNALVKTMTELASLVEKGISDENHELVKFVEKLKDNEYFYENVDLQDAYKQITETLEQKRKNK